MGAGESIRVDLDQARSHEEAARMVYDEAMAPALIRAPTITLTLTLTLTLNLTIPVLTITVKHEDFF